MRAASSLSALGARRLYVAGVSRSWTAFLTGSSRSVAAASRTTERRRMSLSRPTTASPSLTTAAAAASPPPASFSLYSHPRLYDAVFAFRDFDAEARFLVHAWELYGEGGEGEGLSSFLDVGCGTGRHGAALARLLLRVSPAPAPLSLFALDSSPEMLSAAARAAEEAGCPLRQAIEADMTRGFEISERVQLALCALGTLAHALPASDPGAADPALGALRAASGALVPGGILVLELPAAGDLFDGTLLAGDAWDVPAGAWRKENGDGGGFAESNPEPEQKRRIGQISRRKASSPSSPALIVEYGLPDDDFDPVSQVLRRTVVVSEASEDGSGEAGREVGREEVKQRLFTPAEVRALARVAGFAVAAELGDMEIGEGEESMPTAREGDRYVAVLVKKK